MSESDVTALPKGASHGYYGPDGQPRFFEDSAMDRFVAVLTELTQECWVALERIDAIERLLRDKGVVTADDFARLRADSRVTAEREKAVGQFISRTLHSLREP